MAFVALDCELPQQAASVRNARRAVRDVATPLCDDLAVIDLLLVVSELATNAVIHARSAFRVRLVVDRLESSIVIRVEVSDTDPTLPVRREPCPTQPGGRGLALVDLVSDRWGAQTSPTGKYVYADVSGHYR